jgi:hypothetical protein
VQIAEIGDLMRLQHAPRQLLNRVSHSFRGYPFRRRLNRLEGAPALQRAIDAAAAKSQVKAG